MSTSSSAKVLEHTSNLAGPRDREDIELWLVDYLTRLLKLEATEVRADATFDSFGLDSAATVGLTGDLSEWLRMEVDPSVAYDHPTITSLSKYLAEEVVKAT
jgi:acyl carrier protein